MLQHAPLLCRVQLQNGVTSMRILYTGIHNSMFRDKKILRIRTLKSKKIKLDLYISVPFLHLSFILSRRIGVGVTEAGSPEWDFTTLLEVESFMCLVAFTH